MLFHDALSDHPDDQGRLDLYTILYSSASGLHFFLE